MMLPRTILSKAKILINEELQKAFNCSLSNTTSKSINGYMNLFCLIVSNERIRLSRLEMQSYVGRSMIDKNAIDLMARRVTHKGYRINEED